MLADVRERIEQACARAGRSPADVRLVAVTKGRTIEDVRRHLLDHGHRTLGESRVQEWRAKAAQLGAEVEWHLVGHLQTNKVRLCRRFALLHGVDSARLVDALEAHAAAHRHVFVLLLQVNVSGEASKHGVDPRELGELVARVTSSPHLRLEGLMTMAPYHPDPERARPHFRALRALSERYAGGRTSMGMSGDFEVAVEEGATWLRIGAALFQEVEASA